jgi:hypothetical protein
MRFIEDLCPPALLYLIFLVVQLGLDASLGMWITFAVKTFLGLATVVLLDVFCDVELGVVSWFLVATPFIITALATSIAMGSNFDQTILVQMKEKFVGNDQTTPGDPPASTGSPKMMLDISNGSSDKKESSK